MDRGRDHIERHLARTYLYRLPSIMRRRWPDYPALTVEAWFGAVTVPIKHLCVPRTLSAQRRWPPSSRFAFPNAQLG